MTIIRLLGVCGIGCSMNIKYGRLDKRPQTILYFIGNDANFLKLLTSSDFEIYGKYHCMRGPFSIQELDMKEY